MYSEMVRVILCFPPSYMVESGFSSANKILSKERKRMDICARGDIRIRLSNIKPKIKELASKHQAQGSCGRKT